MTSAQKAKASLFALLVVITCLVMVYLMILDLEKQRATATKTAQTQSAPVVEKTEFVGQVITGPISVHSGTSEHLVYVVFSKDVDGVVRVNAEDHCPVLRDGEGIVIKKSSTIHEEDMYIYLRPL